MASYNSIPYIQWQLKILYELNNPSDFKVVIVENNSKSEVEDIRCLSKLYKNKFNNIDVFYHKPKLKKKNRILMELDQYCQKTNMELVSIMACNM
jgi:hypothetical protein